MNAEPAGSRRVQSLDRAFGLLRAVAASPGPAAVNDLADACGLNRSTAWRLLMTLEHHGFVERDRATQGYLVGHEVMRMAALRAGQESIVDRARPLLGRLAVEFGETTGLALPTGAALTVIAQHDPGRAFGVNLVEALLPLHASASGKARLAFDPQAVPAGELASFTPRTITSTEALDDEMRRTRQRGFAIEQDEFELGVSGAGAPVFAGDALRAVVSFWGLSSRLSRQRILDFGRRLRAGADELSSELSGTISGSASGG